MTFRTPFTAIIFLILFAIIITPVMAKDTNNPVPQYEIKLAKFFYPDSVVSHIYHADLNPQWIRPDAFWYTDNGKETTTYVLVNVSQGTRKQFIDTSRLTSSISKVTGKTINQARLPIQDMTLSSDERSISFRSFDDTWICDLSTYTITKENLPDEIENGIPSPDKNFIAYVNGSNLWIYNTGLKVSSPLTTDGSTDSFYGKRSDTVRYAATEQRLNETQVPYLVWSPDSAKIATFRVDQRNVSPLWLVQDAPSIGARPLLYSYKFAYPGDTHVPLYEPVIIDIHSRQITKMQTKPQPEVSMMDTDQDVLQWWDSTGNGAYQLAIDRGEQALHLLSGNPGSGTVRELVSETGSSYIESNLEYAEKPNVAVLTTGDIIWFSERDGWGHLYRYDANGTLKNQITKGPWVVREILAIDEPNGHIYFTASGKEGGNPYYRYLYRVQMDGNDLVLLTPGQADHAITLSPDGRWFIDAYSRTDLPTVTDLKTIDGSLLMHLATADDTELRRIGWVPPERVTFTGRDGETEQFGLVFKPTNFDNTKKYPVIDVVYPGPYTIVTATEYPADLSWNSKIFWTCQMLSELGYVVVTMDGMGTAYRSKEFHNVSYGHLSDCGLPDHIAGLKQLASRYPFMDISRVGIYGKSAGGFMAAQAMLTYPEFFKVGVAGSGDQDCRLYGSFWGEKYEGYPVTQQYQEQVTALKAENLAGKLLLLTGDMDDNVHPSMTMQLVDAFQQAGKSVDMFVFTNRNHDLNYDPYYLKKMMSYFVDNL